MDLISRKSVKASMVYLLIGVTLGTLMIINPKFTEKLVEELNKFVEG